MLESEPGLLAIGPGFLQSLFEGVECDSIGRVTNGMDSHVETDVQKINRRLSRDDFRMSRLPAKFRIVAVLLEEMSPPRAQSAVQDGLDGLHEELVVVELRPFDQVTTLLIVGHRRQRWNEVEQLSRCALDEFSRQLPVLILFEMTALRIGGLAGNAGELQGFTVGGAAVGITDDVDGVIRRHGIDQLFAEDRRVPDIRHPTAQNEPPRLGRGAHAFPRGQRALDSLPASVRRRPTHQGRV